jgi:hypothetical protein
VRLIHPLGVRPSGADEATLLQSWLRTLVRRQVRRWVGEVFSVARESLLASWVDTSTRQAIVDFVAGVTDDGGAAFVPEAERAAVVDNDGTLWSEKPIPTQIDFMSCGFVPMIELLRYLEANGFSNYIASGGDRDFMRPFAEQLYGIHRSGSSAAPWAWTSTIKAM